MSSFADGRTHRRPYRSGACAFLLLLAVAACSTKVGTTSNTSPNPSAVITPIGHKATAGSGSASVAITVRSGSAVILSGKDSDGRGVALSGFVWSQTAGPALPKAPDVGALLYQTSNTVVFTAPQVAADTVYTFQLKVTNALNASSTATAAVTVTAANDPDQFLVQNVVDQNISSHTPRRFIVAVATDTGLIPANLSGDVPACITVSRQLSYQSRDGTLHDGTHSPMLSLPQLPRLQATVYWKASVGSVGTAGLALPYTTAFQSTSNPRAVFDVPALNDVELVALFNQPGADPSVPIPTATVNQQLVPSDLDTAQLYLSVAAAAGACGTQASPGALTGVSLPLAIYAPGGKTPVLTNGGSGPLDQYEPDPTVACTAACAPLTADLLLTAVGLANNVAAETLKSATAYYKAIDPTGAKTTLNAWLDANCFDSTQTDYGVKAAGTNAAHAVYTNNYDLGFGRDMYFVTCTASSPAVIKGLASAGDMASVVVNYNSLEQTALKQAPVLAVAMEYSADANSNGKRFPKFYAFAPDDRTGAYTRVSSANFDRRGEKYLPGACLSCHGGTITDTTFANTGDVDASFMPWDLDALLYADTDPAFNPNTIGSTPYTRAAQEPNLKQLNALAWQTYQTHELQDTIQGGSCSTPGATCVDRFAAPLALLMKWYGPNGPSDPKTTYDDSATPSDWPATTPAAAPGDLYHAVYAHHCRSCHTQNSTVKKQFTDFPTFVSSYINPGNAVTGVQSLIYKSAQMPLARLTADRFWVDYGGGASAAQTLATYVNGQTGAPGVAVDSKGDVVLPGAPVFNAKVYSGVTSAGGQQLTLAVGGLYPVTRFSESRTDFSSNVFASSYQASLCLQQTTDPMDGTPCVAQPAIFVGAGNAVPAFDTSAWGIYNLKMAGTSGDGLTGSSTVLIQVKQSVPNIANCNQNPSLSLGVSTMTTVVNLATCSTLGDTPLLQIQDATGNWQPAPNTLLNYTISAPQYTANLTGCTIAGSVVSGCNITFAFSASALGPVILNYRLLDQYDNIASAATSTISVTRSYSAIVLAPYVITLTPNLGSPSPPATLCIPLASTTVAPVSSTAPCTPNTSVPLLTGEVNPPGDQFKMTLLSGTPPAGTLVPAAGTAIDTNLNGGNVVSYTTPSSGFPSLNGSYVTCDVNGQDIMTSNPTCTGVTIPYTLQSDSTAGTPTCSTSPAPPGFICNSFKVLVNATSSFTQQTNGTPPAGLTGAPIYSTLSASGRCTNCHDPGNTPSLPASCSTNPAQPLCKYWVYTNPATIATNAANTLQTLTNAGATTCVSGSTNCITKGDPGLSQLYLNVCGTAPVNQGHGPVATSGSPGPQQFTQSECNTLSQWIAEGANLN